MKLKMRKEYFGNSYICTLHDVFDKEQGVIRITVKSVDNEDCGEIDFFCVAKRYRHTKHKYGKELLNSVINDMYKDRNVRTFMVYPRGEELYDECEEVMDVDTLCIIYEKLGFELVGLSSDKHPKMIMKYIP